MDSLTEIEDEIMERRLNKKCTAFGISMTVGSLVASCVTSFYFGIDSILIAAALCSCITYFGIRKIIYGSRSL